MRDHFKNTRSIASVVALAFVPARAFGDGGISSLSGLLPIVIALLIIALLLFVWTIFSAVMFLSEPARVSAGSRKTYLGISIGLGILLLAGLTFFSLFASPALLGGLLLIAVVVGVVSNLAVMRLRSPDEPQAH